MIINHICKLGLKGGDIDLNKKFFTEKIKNHESLLIVSFINNNKKWLKKVVEWRDQLIHRGSNPIVTIGNPEQIGNFSLYICMKPLTIFDQSFDPAKMSYTTISDFCDPWLVKSNEMIDTISTDPLLFIGIGYLEEVWRKIFCYINT